MRERRKESFLEEKLMMVGKALQQLKKDQRIRGFLRTGPFSFAKRVGIDFYVVYVSDVKYIARSLSVARNHKNNKSSIKVSLFDSQGSIRRKVLEAIKGF